jgi:hypothetical protein
MSRFGKLVSQVRIIDGATQGIAVLLIVWVRYTFPCHCVREYNVYSRH